MTYFLRAHGWWAVLASIVGATALFALLSTYSIPLPSIVAGGLTPVRSAAVLTLIPSIATAWSLDRTPRFLQGSAVRPIRAIQLLVITVAVAAPAIIVEAVTIVTPMADATMYLRDDIGYLGLALIGRLVMREGALLPAVFLLIATLFGPQLGGRVAWWAWCIAPSKDTTAFVIAAGLLAVGVTVHLIGGEPRLIAGLRSA